MSPRNDRWRAKNRRNGKCLDCGRESAPFARCLRHRLSLAARVAASRQKTVLITK